MPPRSLFDRTTPGMLKIRREGKEQKKNILLNVREPLTEVTEATTPGACSLSHFLCQIPQAHLRPY